MKGLLFCFIAMISGFGCAHAQTIEGKVYDRDTKEPVGFASVYLDGTSVYTLTDAEGSFKLTAGKVINTNLVISHLNYEMVTLADPFNSETIPDIIYLSEKKNIINDVVVRPDEYTREQKLAVFREQFLGATKAGQSCKILNEDDIDLHFNLSANCLTAWAENPLIIKNDYLGYQITYRLVEFYVTNPFYSTRFGAPQQTVTKGTTSFADLAPGSNKMKKRRDEIYKMSSIAFFKGLATESLEESNFRIFSNRMPADPKNYFRVTDSLGMKKVSLLPDAAWYKEADLKDGSQVKGVIDIMHDRKDQSGLIFLTDSFMVDEYGNTDLTDGLLFYGCIGALRTGCMLPLEYEVNRIEK